MIATMSPSSDPRGIVQLKADSDLCVKCGLCLPHCPTYLDTQHEGDSPRGRIALVQGLVSGVIAPTARAEMHLDGCLSCRRCEVVCPARVPYSKILDAGRAELAVQHPARTRFTRLLALLLISDLSRALLRAALWMYRALPIQRVLRRTGLLGHGRLARLESLLPAMTPAEGQRDVAVSAITQTDATPIAMFRGCVSDVLEPKALDAAEQLLRAAGYRIQSAPAQTCCGALYQRAGMPIQARVLAQTNIAAFAGCERIASVTTGCAASLRDYADMDVEGGAALAPRVRDFADWLLPRSERLQFRPLPLRAALHTPCTALNVMKSDVALRQLLQRIPQLELLELDPSQRCCGAAGTHFVTQPEAADRLLQPKLDAIQRLKPDLIISANIGCSLHLSGGLTRSAAAGQPPGPVVRHPAQVLAEQLVWPPLQS